MTVEPLVVLSVGETPTTQFVSWRLSLTNTFLVQVSEYIAADGVVSWKSNKYGSNFYKPNLFAKDLDSLNKLAFDKKGRPKYKVDILLIAANSKQQYLELTRSLKLYVSEKTLIVVDCNFGVGLDELALQQFEGKKHAGVLSLLADIECRKLSSGSYALVSEMCKLFFGLTYSESNTSNDQFRKLKEHNTNLIRTQYANFGSVLNLLIQVITSTGINKVHKVCVNTPEMAVKIWYYIIPKIAFNALSIVFEDPYYELFTDPEDFPRSLSEDIIKELMAIAYTHSGKILSSFCISSEETLDTREEPSVSSISYQKVFEVVKNKSKELNTFTISEAPEYLTLSFETYSFFHKIDYPASILLSQTLDLATLYKLPKLGLKFLFGFYSKLSLLAGMPPLNHNVGIKTKDRFLFGRGFFNGAMSKTQSTEGSHFSDFKNSSKDRLEFYGELQAKSSKHKCKCGSNSTKTSNSSKKQNTDNHFGGKAESTVYSLSDDADICVSDELFDLYVDVIDSDLDKKKAIDKTHDKRNMSEVQSEYSSDDGFYSLNNYYQNTNTNNQNSQKQVSTSLTPYKKELSGLNQYLKQKEPVFFGFYLHKDPYTKDVVERYLSDADGDDLEKALKTCHLYDDFGRYQNILLCKNNSPDGISSTTIHDPSKSKMLVKMSKMCKRKSAFSHRNLSTSVKDAELTYLQGIKISSQDPVNSGNFGHMINVSSTRFGNLEFGYQVIQKNENERLKFKSELTENCFTNTRKDFKPNNQKLIEGSNAQDQDQKEQGGSCKKM